MSISGSVERSATQRQRQMAPDERRRRRRRRNEGGNERKTFPEIDRGMDGRTEGRKEIG